MDEPPLRVFVSSVISGMEAERQAVRAAIDAIRLTRSWLFEFSSASSLPIPESYLREVCRCDIFVLLLSDRISDPVKEEVKTARDKKKPILAFLKQSAPEEVAEYARSVGATYARYDATQDLAKQVTRALHSEIADGFRAGRYPRADGERAETYLANLRTETAREIRTEGAPYYEGDVHVPRGVFIGGNLIILEGGAGGGDLAQVLTRLTSILQSKEPVYARDPANDHLLITGADGRQAILSEDAAEELLSIAAPRLKTEEAYLTALLLNPYFARWGRQFVPMEGTLTSPDGWPTEHGPISRDYSLRMLHGEGAGRQVSTVPLKDVGTALDSHKALALLGEPGCGKTTQLRKLAHDAASNRLAGHGGMLPVFVSLNDFRGSADPHEFLQTALQRFLGARDLDQALQDDRLLLLCDAMNEMPFTDDKDRRLRVKAWWRFADNLPSGSRLVISCRSDDYLLEPLGLPQVEIKELDDDRVQEFLGKYLPEALAGAVWDRLINDDRPEEQRLLQLVRNPYYLQALCLVTQQQQTWPANRADLLRQSTELLLHRERTREHADFPGVAPMRLALSALAEVFVPASEGTFRPRAEVLESIPPRVTTVNGPIEVSPEAVIHIACAAMLLDERLAPDGTRVCGFYHQQLQEYFAAEALLARWKTGEDVTDRWLWPRTGREMPDPGRVGDFDLLPPPPGTRWEQSTIMATGLAPDPDAFLRDVLQINPALAARCYAEGGVACDDALAEELQTALLSDMTDMRLHLRARLAAGDALGRVGDPRFKKIEVAGKRVLIPPLIHIPVGKVRMGSRRWEVWRLLRQGFPIKDELTGDTVTVSEFWVGQFPVTNAEFACFVDAKGYEKEQYWRTDAARAWRRGELGNAALESELDFWRYQRAHPEEAERMFALWSDRSVATGRALLRMSAEALERQVSKWFVDRPMDLPAYWGDSRYNGATQPVVGVTWFEVSAYCAWLDEQLQAAKAAGLRDAPVLPAGYAIRLPTEAEWERAARMDRGWAYPWGNWQAGHANTWEAHITRPSPVGIYPNGTTREGVNDLSGNVWEWTRSLYQPYPYRDDGRNDPAAEDARVVRGGSWYGNQRFARCAFRVRYEPGNFNDFLGFRVALSLSS